MSKYVILSTTEYGKGRIALFASRFSNLMTDNTTAYPPFVRSLLEWASIRDEDEVIRVCSVDIGNVSSTFPEVDLLEKVTVDNRAVSFLSDYKNLAEFHCLILSGLGNNISPLIRQNILSFVLSGGGLVVSDFDAKMEQIELFDHVSSVYVVDSGYVSPVGGEVWQEIGLLSPLFDESYSDMFVKLTNTIRVGDLGSKWDSLLVMDTESAKVVEQDEIQDELLYQPSSDFLVKGASFVAYYGSVYRNGLVDIQIEE